MRLSGKAAVITDAGSGIGVPLPRCLEQGAPIHAQDERVVDQVTRVNPRGVYFGMAYGIMAMLRGGGGSISPISAFQVPAER